MPLEIKDARVFDLYEKAKIAYPEADINPPCCHFCKRETGYIEFSEEEKPALRILIGVSNFDYFQMESKVYARVSRCVYCESYYLGKSGYKDFIKGAWKLPDYSWHPDGANLNRRYARGFDEFNKEHIPEQKKQSNKKDMIRKEMSRLGGLYY